MIKRIIDWLREPSMENVDIDGACRLAIHRRMLERKRMLREAIEECHHRFRHLDETLLFAKGARVEIGTGVAPIRDLYSDVLATDIVFGPGLDLVIDAENMDFEDSTVRAVYGQNCFHHFPHPDRFFDELERVLCPGGGAVLLEPYYGPLASFLYRRLFRTEGYDKDCPAWETPMSGPMNGANQALSYIVFVRDRTDFERKHTKLEIVKQELCGNHMKYLLSGGLNFRRLLPDWTTPLVGFVEILLSPLNRWIALHHILLIRKKHN